MIITNDLYQDLKFLLKNKNYQQRQVHQKYQGVKHEFLERMVTFVF